MTITQSTPRVKELRELLSSHWCCLESVASPWVSQPLKMKQWICNSKLWWVLFKLQLPLAIFTRSSQLADLIFTCTCKVMHMLVYMASIMKMRVMQCTGTLLKFPAQRSSTWSQTKSGPITTFIKGVIQFGILGILTAKRETLALKVTSLWMW